MAFPSPPVLTGAVKGLVSLARNPLREDPTRTKLIRDRFSTDLRRRYQLLARHVRAFIESPLGLGSQLLSLLAEKRYTLYTSTGKLTAFGRWFQEQVEKDILSPTALAGVPVGSMGSGPWTTTYIEKAYRQGLRNAFIVAKRKGSLTEDLDTFLRRSLQQPTGRAKVDLFSLRSLDQIKGLSEGMRAQMSRILSEGITANQSPEKIAQRMSQQIRGMSEDRAIKIARTEVVAAHAEGQLDTFEALGIEDLTILAEWVTAGDDRVCPECHAFEGKVFTISQARGKIPLHPQCRCAWVPLQEDKRRK